MSAFFTDSGKARLIPNEIAPPATAHAGSAPSLHGRGLSPRVLECFYCAHGEPQDLGFVWSWLEGRFVPACVDETWCSFREWGNR